MIAWEHINMKLNLPLLLANDHNMWLAQSLKPTGCCLMHRLSGLALTIQFKLLNLKLGMCFHRMVAAAAVTSRYTQQEVVFAVAKGRNPDLTPPDTCVMVYGPGQQHFGTYGLGAECCW